MNTPKPNTTNLFILETILLTLLTAVSVYLTGQYWLILAGAVIVASIYLLLMSQRRKYERDLETVTDMVENLISGDDAVIVSETGDVMKSKIQHQLIKLNGMIMHLGAEPNRSDND
jgi:hypothetical protein